MLWKKIYGKILKYLRENIKIFTEIHKDNISSVIRNAVKEYLKEQKELEEVLKNLTSEHFETVEIIKL